MLTGIYDKLVNTFWGEPRPLIRRFLEEFDCSPGIYIVKLPTGYGKTSIVFTQAMSTLMGKCSSSTIYVAPLRSLVDDVYYRWSKIVSQILSNDIVEEVSGVQHMGVAGSVYLNKPVVYTTMDTFLLHLFKLPPPELRKYAKAITSHRIYRGHYEVSRGLMANSTILLDEPHLTIHSTAMLKAFLSAIRFLAYIKSAIVLMTATMPKKLEELIVESVKGYLGIDKIRKYNYGENGFIDREFEEKQSSKNIETETKCTLNKRLGVTDIVEASNSYDRVLVVVNRRTRAVELYSQARKLLSRRGLDDRLFLLHGFMLEGERRRIIEKVRELSRNYKQFILITTQVVEAGFDLSSDILLTELAPPPSIIQRVGRVARWNEDHGVVKIYDVEEPKPYTRDDIEKTREVLKSTKCILWKTPRSSSSDECIDYIEFLEKATIIRDDGILSDIYNTAGYVADVSSTLTLLYKVFSGELLRETFTLLTLYVDGRFDEGGIPVDLHTVASLLGEGKITGYLRDDKVVGKEGLDKLKKIIDACHPIKTWALLEAEGIRGLIISNRTYEELAYGG